MNHILFAAAESAPFVKTGGLGAVLGSLPKALRADDLKVSLVLPGYQCIGEEYHKAMKRVKVFALDLGWRHTYVELCKLSLHGIDCYFIKNDDYFSGDQPYGEIWMDIEKYAFFAKAALEMLRFIGEQIDIIHCHDWQTGLIPVFMRTTYACSSYYSRIKVIMTIHNLKFQGICDIYRMKEITGLPDSAFSYDKLEYYGKANMLKGGIAYADLVTTVSKTYAEEIQTEEYGEGLHLLLSYRKEDLFGIVNGIDWDLYDPEKDPFVEYPYHVENYKEERPKNKKVLQETTGLSVRDVFTMGIVSRLTEQKGFKLMEAAIDDLLKEGAQVYILGDGEQWIKDMVDRYKKAFPDQVYFAADYSDTIAKKIYAGCDLTLMPSRFEPCGLNQMMAMRYGCLPLVRATGGLKDTVEDDGALSAKGCGFVFESYEKAEFKECLLRAKQMYDDYPELWQERVAHAMRQDFSWESSAKVYRAIYDKIAVKKEF